MSRKDAINSLFLNKPQPPAPSPARPVERVRTGAIAAMGASLQEMSETARAAEKLKQQLATGDAVIALDPARIDGSMVLDRIPVDVDPGFDKLVQSMAENGQQVPILVRPHPGNPNRFQIAYGRRRLRAAMRLGRTVRAIVRNLSDAELVVAQGRENLERQDLSFIEKALFARRLEDAGYERPTIMAALSTDKADLSRYIAIARRIPEPIIQRIGPASKAGRARWQALAEQLGDPNRLKQVEALFQEGGLLELDSNARFQAVWKALEKPASATRGRAKGWATPHGKRAVQIEAGQGRTALVFHEKVVPEFAAFISSRLDELYRAYEEERARE